MTYKKSKPVKCPFCDIESKHEKKIDIHLQSDHGTTLEAAYVRFRLGGIPNSCKCGCGTTTKFNGWKKGYTLFARGHNARIDSSFSNPDIIKKCVSSRAESFAAGKYTSWNAGLTGSTGSIGSSFAPTKKEE